MFFAFSIFIEGTTEKVLQFIMPVKSIYNKNLGFIEQKMFFGHHIEVLTIKNLSIDIIFVIKILFGDLPRVASYSLMLVSHKDALFH